MRITRVPIVLLAVTLAAACSPDARLAGPDARSPAFRNGAAFGAGLASPVWQARAAELVTQAGLSPTSAGRIYPLVGVAQYLAVQQAGVAEGDAADGGRARYESERGAVAGASAVVLSDLFPAAAATLEDLVIAQANAGPGGVHPAFVRGEAIGRAVGAQIVARGHADGFNNPFTGTIPSGPGLWVSNTTPPTIAGGTLPTTTPWFLTSANQFRPGPPPAFGSAEFLADLAEIRQISDTRTPMQTAIAIFWGQGAGTPTTPGFWVLEATSQINAHGLSEREATHLYALVSATILDAQIACWDAKQTYWFIRPWRADPAITTLAQVGRPNHPSYPSGHSCVSSSAAAVLAAFFPEEQLRLDAMVEEAGLSRMYAGIHYRFDILAGRQIGLSVAVFTIAADASGNSVLTPH